MEMIFEILPHWSYLLGLALASIVFVWKLRIRDKEIKLLKKDNTDYRTRTSELVKREVILLEFLKSNGFKQVLTSNGLLLWLKRTLTANVYELKLYNLDVSNYRIASVCYILQKDFFVLDTFDCSDKVLSKILINELMTDSGGKLVLLSDSVSSSSLMNSVDVSSIIGSDTIVWVEKSKPGHKVELSVYSLYRHPVNIGYVSFLVSNKTVQIDRFDFDNVAVHQLLMDRLRVDAKGKNIVLSDSVNPECMAGFVATVQ